MYFSLCSSLENNIGPERWHGLVYAQNPNIYEFHNLDMRLGCVYFGSRFLNVAKFAKVLREFAHVLRRWSESTIAALALTIIGMFKTPWMRANQGSFPAESFVIMSQGCRYIESGKKMTNTVVIITVLLYFSNWLHRPRGNVFIFFYTYF